MPEVTEAGGGTSIVRPDSILTVGTGVILFDASAAIVIELVAVGVAFGSKAAAGLRAFFAGVPEAPRPCRADEAAAFSSKAALPFFSSGTGVLSSPVA